VRDENVPLVAAAYRALVDQSDAAHVQLVVDDARLERGPLLRLEGAPRVDRGRAGRRVEVEYAEVVLGMSPQELLAERLPDLGWAGMMTPARAPFTPESHEPSRLVTFPLRSSSAVSSPKYQTVPPRSCAYQSVVRSARCAGA
jgi:hypothetical protein